MSKQKGIKTENLSVGYGKKVLIENICIEVLPGKLLTLLGPNGSGKSTILKTVTKQLDKMGGKVLVLGNDTESMSDNDFARTVSMVMTERIRPDMMSCREVVETGRYPYTGKMGILRREDKAAVQAAIDLVQAGDYANEPFEGISDGQRQRIMLARAICQEPEVLALDEPTAFLDIRFKLEILLKIKELAVEKNIAIVMSLHEPDLAAKISDYVVAVGSDGIQKYGTSAEIINRDFIRKLYGIGDKEFALLKSGDSWWDVAAGENHVTENSLRVCSESGRDSENYNSKKAPGKAKVIMVQGTMSNAGKSLLVAGLCRIFKQDGYRVAPFKSQNMALNSYITEDGLEMGRAQVMQAECCGMKPHVCMNPILLKPTSDVGSQVIVNGEVIGNMRAREYFAYKTKLIPDIIKAYDTLSEMADIIVVEGAGSPAEINLKSNDIVNMGLAKILDAPVILVGDIDRGGVFAQLVGTLQLLEKEEKDRVKGLVINKFRGDKSLLDSGVDMLRDIGKVPVVGVVPYMNIMVEDEDSLTERFDRKKKAVIDIAVVRLPHISNFTDMNVFEQIPEISVRYIKKPDEIGDASMIILPGSKNTINDLNWLKDSGFDKSIKEKSEAGIPVFGICGGYQMMGVSVSDPEGVECGGETEGLGLLPVKTVLKNQKNRSQYAGKIVGATGLFSGLNGLEVNGYEIHMGETTVAENSKDSDSNATASTALTEFTGDATGYCSGNVYGTYIHGVFDSREIVSVVAQSLAEKAGVRLDIGSVLDYREFKETQYDKMADILREHMDMKAIYEMLAIDKNI